MEAPKTQPAQAPPGVPTHPAAHIPAPRDQELLAKSELSIWIDTYDDIFSDFDPRPYRERAISVDFLDEAKRYSRDKKGRLQVRILAPRNVRNIRMEAVVRKRLLEHFKRHADIADKEEQELRKRGIKFVIAGSAILIAATLVVYYGEEGILKDFLTVLLEPAGWFTAWNGFDMLTFTPKELKSEADFYTKMASADIVFESY